MPPHDNDGTYATNIYQDDFIFRGRNTFNTTPLDFTTAGTYTVTAENAPTNTWTTYTVPDWTTTLNDRINFNREYSHEELKAEVDAEVDRRLEHIFKKMYEIIHDICNFSISEDEFMKLLKED